MNPDYSFLPHYRYFLDNCKRWGNSAQIQSRILAPVSSDHEKAWQEWRQFRSAQAEVTSVYLIENYLGGNVNSIEVSRPDYKKLCDISARFGHGKDSYLEVKSQSGQQHGDKHPLSEEADSFTPQGEEDLLSWLFKSRKSSTTGKPMVPYCLQVSEKGADVLIAMIDIVQWETADLHSLGKLLVPDCQYFRKAIFDRQFDRSPEPESQLQTPNSMDAVVIGAGTQTTERMGSLREIWVSDDSALDKLLVIRAAGVAMVLPDWHSTGRAEKSRPPDR